MSHSPIFHRLLAPCAARRLRGGAIIFLLWLAGALDTFAQPAPLWLRYPAISPDGTQIAFSYRGDLYLVPSSGGQAAPLTIHSAHEFMPVWCRDGRRIAFASDRHGNFDVFVANLDGGEPDRLTFNSVDDFPTDFTPDGSSVLFHSSRRDTAASAQFPSGLLPELYRVPLRGGRTIQVLTTPAQDARYDRSGRRLVYHDRKGYENEWRKHHVSSVARDLWLCDLVSGKHTKLTEFRGEDRNPVWSADEKSVYYLSEQSGSFNVWKLALDEPAGAIQLTRHTNHPVRFLTASVGGDLCYSFNGEIYLQRGEAAPAQKVRISITTGPKQNDGEFATFTADATEMKISPQGKELALVIRGEVFVASIEHKVTKRITSTPGQERSVSFSPDGRSLLYAGERDGSWNLYRTTLSRTNEPYFYNSTVLVDETLLKNGRENFQPRFSPDGKEVAYLEDRSTINVLNLESRRIRQILAGDMNYSYSDGDQWFDWSPDGKWLLVEFLDKTRWSVEAGLMDAEGKGPLLNLTKNGYEDARPQWMMDGKMMLWVSDRYGMRSHGSWGAEGDVFGMFFTQDAFDRFSLSKAEFELLTEREKKEKEEKEKKQKKEDASKDAKKDDSDSKKEAPKVEPFKFELDNIEERVARLTVHSSDLADAILTPDGEKLLYLARFEKGHDLWLHKLRDKETKVLAKLGAEGGSLALDKEGKHVFVLAGGKVTKVEIENGKQEPVGFSAEMNLDLAAERIHLFEHVWRQVLSKFYVADLHQVNWSFYKAEYLRFLPHINNNWDFSEMLSELLGELNASHTGAGHRPRPKSPDATAALGAFFDPEFAGPGLRIAEIIEKGPLRRSGTEIQNGDIIEKLDGVEITGDPDVLLNRKAGKPTLLSLFNPGTQKRWDEVVKPISRGEENELLFDRWVKSRRIQTSLLSNGKIGYLHVRSMNDPSFRNAFADLFGRNSDKDALIVDTRFNGGGWLHDDLADLLSGKTYFSFVPRGIEVGQEPRDKWRKPSIVLMSEGNYSNAHMFPLVFRKLGIGELVGMPVPGTGTAVWWETLQDPTLYFGIPQVGIKDNDGNYLENQELHPDHLVANDPESLAKGRDRQLEKAVELLLKK